MSHLTDSPAVRREMEREHNVLAAASSVILPGLGHIYKGRYWQGVAILLLGAPLAIWSGLLLSLATFGLGLFIPVMYWAATAACAYYAEDHRVHHPFHLL